MWKLSIAFEKRQILKQFVSCYLPAKCAPAVQWTACVGGEMSQTLTPSVVEGCEPGVEMTNTFNCTATIIKGNNLHKQ